jgi:hypothetical protein
MSNEPRFVYLLIGYAQSNRTSVLSAWETREAAEERSKFINKNLNRTLFTHVAVEAIALQQSSDSEV